MSAASFNPAIKKLRDPPVSVVKDWKASYDGSRGDLIDMSEAVPGYSSNPSKSIYSYSYCHTLTYFF